MSLTDVAVYGLLLSAFIFAGYIFSAALHAVQIIFFKADATKSLIRKKRAGSAKTLIVMGSGGHTAEMVTLLSELDFEHFSPRFYVVAETDETSSHRVRQMEVKRKTSENQYKFLTISRSREVHQSWFTTIFSTLVALVQSVGLLLQHRADLILVNGPGTCVPICLASFFLKAFWIHQSTVVFVESICRVKSLSLTGKIMCFLADCCVVQWKNLKDKYPKAVYLGRLV